MKISCLCPTYNRCPDQQHLLEEAIESFLRQDHADRELIILNDCPGQELVCDAPGVRIFNWSTRFKTLGAKYNMLVGLSTSELICPWDDDDISLPHRLSQSIEHIGGKQYWNPGKVYYCEEGQPPREDNKGVNHNASMYRKKAWVRVGCYPHVPGGQDKLLDLALKRLNSNGKPLTDSRPSYCYRWLVSDRHLSDNNNNYEQRYRNIGRIPIRKGTFLLRPHWREDYLKKVLEFNTQLPTIPDPSVKPKKRFIF